MSFKPMSLPRAAHSRRRGRIQYEALLATSSTTSLMIHRDTQQSSETHTWRRRGGGRARVHEHRGVDIVHEPHEHHEGQSIARAFQQGERRHACGARTTHIALQTTVTRRTQRLAHTCLGERGAGLGLEHGLGGTCVTARRTHALELQLQHGHDGRVDPLCFAQELRLGQHRGDLSDPARSGGDEAMRSTQGIRTRCCGSQRRRTCRRAGRAPSTR